MFNISRLAADNTSANPSHEMVLSADAVTLYSPLLQTNLEVYAPTSLVASIMVVGPGGRDQVAPFTALTTVWFYYIYGIGLPLSVIISNNPPSPAGPSLPIGYTHFCPAFPMKIADDGSIMLKALMWPPSTNPARTMTRIRGNRAYYGSAIFYDFPNFLPVAFGGAPLTYGAFDFSWATPAGIATINLEIDAEIHQTPGGQLIGGVVLSWLQVGGVSQNDINISLYQPILTYTFPNAQDLVADFPVNPGAGMWGIYSISGGGVDSTDFCVFVRGYSW